MKKNLSLLILSIFLINCATNNSLQEKEIILSDGKIIRISFEEKEVRKNEKILVAKYRVDERIAKEETVEKQILEIWKNLENFADKKELSEGIIAAKYFIGKDEEGKNNLYQEFLFETEKIENGTWKIRKVN